MSHDTDQAAPSRYDHDPRVTRVHNGFTVTTDDGDTFHVLHTDVFAWTICHGPNLDFVPVSGGGFAIGIANPDDAIGALIGDPAPGAAL